MTGTDFFDDDLIQHRDSVRQIRMGKGDEPAPPDSHGSPDSLTGSVAELNLTRMARHKEEVEGQVARAMHELERLRQRQENLEREKHELEELRRKQEEYDRGKREMLGRLGQSLLVIEKEEIRAGQLLELLAASRKRFKTMLAELEAFDEETWADDQMRGELDKALAVIEDTRAEYNKTMAKIQASALAEHKAAEKGVALEEPAVRADSFGHWLKVGLALSLPLSLALAVVAAMIVLFLRMQGWL